MRGDRIRFRNDAVLEVGRDVGFGWRELDCRLLFLGKRRELRRRGRWTAGLSRAMERARSAPQLPTVPTAMTRLSLGASGLCLLLAAACSTDKYVRRTTDEAIERTPERVERGAYLVNQAASCGACHAPRQDQSPLNAERADLYLAGGALMVENGGLKVTLVTPNITPDPETGIGAWSDDEIMRAVRDGVHRDGHLLFGMPMTYEHMKNNDVRAVVAYMRTVPPIRNRVDRSAARGPGS